VIFTEPSGCPHHYQFAFRASMSAVPGRLSTLVNTTISGRERSAAGLDFSGDVVLNEYPG
jgi:hypothetical protein